MAEVVVGGTAQVVEPVTGFKAVQGGRLLSEAAEVAPDAFSRLADFQTKYREANGLVLTPEMARLPRFQRETVDADGTTTYEAVFSQADFDAAGGTITLPAEPSQVEQIAAVLPAVWKGAERPVVKLVALVLAPNKDLADADETGTVDQYLDDAARRLLHTITLDEIIGVIVVVSEMIGGALGGGDRLGEALGGAASAAGMTGVTEPSIVTKPEASAPATNSQTSPTSLEVKPVGPDAQSSTESPTEN